MSCPACKIILNEDMKTAVTIFHRFVGLDILDADDYEEAMRADEAAIKVYRKINNRAAERHDQAQE